MQAVQCNQCSSVKSKVRDMPRDTVLRAVSTLPASVPIPPTVRGPAGDPLTCAPSNPEALGMAQTASDGCRAWAQRLLSERSTRPGSVAAATPVSPKHSSAVDHANTKAVVRATFTTDLG